MLKAVTPQDAARLWVFVGCEDGTVVVLDDEGELIRIDRVTGTPTHITELALNQVGPVALLATTSGEIKGFT